MFFSKEELDVFEGGGVREKKDGVGRCDLLPLGVVAKLLAHDECRVLNQIDVFMQTGEEDFLYGAIASFCTIKDVSHPQIILDVSMHYKQGAEKYGERNWEKGIPLHSYIDSGVRHFLKHIDGQTDERHDRAFVWNMLGAIWTMEHKPEMIDIPFELIGGKNVQLNKSDC